ncbi:hypothetical protein MRX96_012167 [Rhipicephalus microplus]
MHFVRKERHRRRRRTGRPSQPNEPTPKTKRAPIRRRPLRRIAGHHRRPPAPRVSWEALERENWKLAAASDTCHLKTAILARASLLGRRASIPGH